MISDLERTGYKSRWRNDGKVLVLSDSWLGRAGLCYPEGLDRMLYAPSAWAQTLPLSQRTMDAC